MITLDPMPHAALHFSHERVVTLVLDGELSDTELLEIGSELFRLAHRGHRHVVLDLTDVSHVDYRGVRPLAARAQVFRKAGGDIKLAGMSPYLQAIFRAAGAQEAFEHFETPEIAQAAFARTVT
jgi:anti-sigma B factor antagonist